MRQSVMTNDSLLGDLRSRVLDEDAPVAGLLRTCVMLGSSTGSTGLRSWAQAELRGYGDGVDLPEYRQMHLPLFMDTQNGPLFRRGEQISVFSLPEEAREFVSGPVQFRQSIQELVELSDAQDSSIAITRPGLAEAAMLWSGRLIWRSACQRRHGEAVARTVVCATASCCRDGDRCEWEVSVS